MRRRISKYTLVFTGAVLAAAAGCRDVAPPVAPAVSRPALSQRGKSGNSHLLACGAHDSASVSAVVGHSGASLHLGNVHLVIPGNALADPVLITMTIPADTFADVEFEPHGLQFSKDVVLQLSTANCSLGNQSPAHVVYLDNSGTVQETLDGTYHGNSGTVVTKIHHFSWYAIAF
jgi:hypothetical protein